MITLKDLKEKEKLVEESTGILPTPFVTLRKVAMVGDCVKACTHEGGIKDHLNYQIVKLTKEAIRDCIFLLERMSVRSIIKYKSSKPIITKVSENKCIIEISMGYHYKD